MILRPPREVEEKHDNKIHFNFPFSLLISIRVSCHLPFGYGCLLRLGRAAG
jgi:hypothetical protein